MLDGQPLPEEWVVSKNSVGVVVDFWLKSILTAQSLVDLVAELQGLLVHLLSFIEQAIHNVRVVLITDFCYKFALSLSLVYIRVDLGNEGGTMLLHYLFQVNLLVYQHLLIPVFYRFLLHDHVMADLRPIA